MELYAEARHHRSWGGGRGHEPPHFSNFSVLLYGSPHLQICGAALAYMKNNIH